MTNTVRSVDQPIAHHIKKYYSLIESNQSFKLSDLYQTYFAVKSALHKLSTSHQIDVEALTYAQGRLPSQIFITSKVLLVRHVDDLKPKGINISTWAKASSKARKRLSYYNPLTKTLLFFINSRSDYDDIINCLLAFQIESQKIVKFGIDQKQSSHLASFTNMSTAPDFQIEQLSSTFSFSDLAKQWWTHTKNRFLVYDFVNKPIYFVSSNSHSLVNIIGGYVRLNQNKIFDFIRLNNPDIYAQWLDIKTGQNDLRINDFLYYMSSVYFKFNPQDLDNMVQYHQKLNIHQQNPDTSIACPVQLIPISAITNSGYIDPFIKRIGDLKNNDGYIINIDYPLGFMAYYLLSAILEDNIRPRGIYIVGKAAILSGSPGDMQIPKTVFDERTGNIFRFNNCFNDAGIVSNQFQVHLDQKAVSVYGTYLENLAQLQNYSQSGINIIEMESAPYLMSVAKYYKNIVDPQSQTVDLLDLPVDLGIVNYASDNPLNQTLGSGALGLIGIGSTYLSLLTVLQRIIDIHHDS